MEDPLLDGRSTRGRLTGASQEDQVLGPCRTITLTEARKEVWRFLEPINDVVEGSEHRSRRRWRQLITAWTESIKPTLKALDSAFL